MSQQDKTAAERFKVSLDEFLKYIEGLIQELTLDNMIDDVKEKSTYSLTNVQPGAVTLARALISGYKIETIIEAMASCHNDWQMIKDRKVSFIVQTMKQKFQQNGIPFDVSILSVPFAAYEVIKISEEWRDVDEADLPINADDIEDIWVYLTSLVSVTCSFIHHERGPVMEGSTFIGYSNSGYLPDIDLSKYINMFELSIPKLPHS